MTTQPLAAGLSLAPMIPLVIFLPVVAVLLGLIAGQIVRHRRSLALRVWALRLAMLLLVVVIGFRPAIGGGAPQPTAEGGLEVYFVVDTTSSMAAEDYGDAAARRTGVKSDISQIAQNLPGAEFALVTFDSSAVQRMPLTSDLGALRSAVTVLTQEVSGYSAGSNIDASLDLVTRILTQAKAEKPDRPRVLYYFGDGEQTVESPPRSFAPLAPMIDGGAVLGYGTEAGGPMLTFDGYNDEQSVPSYIMDYTTTPPSVAVSRIDETTLEAISTQLGVGYNHRTAGASVAPLVAGIDVAAPSVTTTPPQAPVELYWIFAIPLVLLLLREALATLDGLRELRPARKEAP